MFITKEVTAMEKKRVLAISGSMRNPSFTEKIMDLCIEGMGEGFEIQKFYPHRMKIGPCLGCWSCWKKTNPGVCIQKDDFAQILKAYKVADYLLMAAPLYFFGLPATVKNVIDRFFVILEPGQYKSPRGGTEHPKRYNRHPKTVLISSCGFPEFENFDLLRRHFMKIAQELDWKWAGEVLVPAAGAAHVPKLFDFKYDLIRYAGAELASGSISRCTTEKIAEAVMPDSDYRRMCTANFDGGLLGNLRRVFIGMKAAAGLAATGRGDS
jgi:multimeric flavodoxin WrbA